MTDLQRSLFDGAPDAAQRVVAGPRPVVAMSDVALDAILGVQVSVAWAGEGRCVPPRLGWWQTDLIDAAGGGDLFARLLPKTHAWASVEAVREAARRVDTKARLGLANPDLVRSLFFLGFDVDEKLAERLVVHKRGSLTPSQALPLVVDLAGAFSASEVAEAFKGTDVEAGYAIEPSGRRLSSPMPDAPELAVRHLAAALVPFAERYPFPYYRVKA